MGVLGVLDDIAIFAQLSGLHVAMLVALAARLLRIPQCEAECARLEESVLLRWPWLAGGDAAALYGTGAALEKAAGLVDSYRGSTLWRRVRTIRSVELRLRDARDGVDCLFALLLCAHANNLLLVVHPASDVDAIATDHRVSDPLHGAQASGGASGCQGGAVEQTMTINQTTSSHGDLNPCDFASLGYRVADVCASQIFSEGTYVLLELVR